MWGADGHDTLLLMQGGGNDVFHGGDGNWVDTIDLREAAEGGPRDGWNFTLTEGTVESTVDGKIELSENSAGTIEFDDGSSLIFDGVEQYYF